MNPPLTIHLMTRDEALADHLLALIASHEREGGLACRLIRVDDLEARAVDLPQLVLVDLDSLTDSALDRIARFRQQGGRSAVAVISQRSSTERLLGAMRAGARDFLPSHPSSAEFGALLQRVAESVVPVGNGPRGRVVVVCSNKGGAGTTTVAVNVAASLAAQLPGPVVVVDCVLQRGDLSVFLDMPTTYTTSHLAAELDRADPSYLRGAIPKHRSGLYVLPSPYAPDDAELITPVQAARLLESLRTTFHAVVVDAGSYVNDVMLAALDAADHVLLVTMPTLPSIRNTKRSLELFERLRYNTGKVILVVNRANAREPVPQAEIAQVLGRPVNWSLPNDYTTAMRAMNEGTVVRAVQRTGGLAAAIDGLVATLILRQTNGPGGAARRRWRWPAVKGFLERTRHGAA